MPYCAAAPYCLLSLEQALIAITSASGKVIGGHVWNLILPRQNARNAPEMRLKSGRKFIDDNAIASDFPGWKSQSLNMNQGNKGQVMCMQESGHGPLQFLFFSFLLGWHLRFLIISHSCQMSKVYPSSQPTLVRRVWTKNTELPRELGIMMKRKGSEMQWNPHYPNQNMINLWLYDLVSAWKSHERMYEVRL